MSRTVVLVCGPPGAGKSTLARRLATEQGLEVLDRDDPHWTSDHAFDRAMERVGQDPNAQAVVIRSGATASARQTAVSLIHPTETRMLAVDEATCIKRIQRRRRTPPSIRQQVGGVRTWWRRYDGGADTPTPGGHPSIVGGGSSSDARPPHFSPRTPKSGGSVARTGRRKRHTPRRKPQLPTAMRGYGADHQRMRRQLEPVVAAGGVRCARGKDCARAEVVNGRVVGGLINPGETWHLDHRDDRRGYLGPAHAYCNTTAPNRNRRRRSRDW